MGAVRLALLAGLLCLGPACSNPRDAYYRDLRATLRAGDAAAAHKQLEDGNKAIYGGRDSLLRPLDTAMVGLQLGPPQTTVAACEAAKAQIEAAYTKHVGEHVEAYVLGDQRLPYVGEPFERVAVHLVEAAAYLQAGLPAEARIEARAMHATLRQTAKLGHETGASYTDDAFGRWLAGLLAGEDEADLGRHDAAVLDLQQALKLYETQDGPRFATPVPQQLVRHLARALRRAQRHDALKTLAQRYPAVQVDDDTELVILHLAGQVPAKHEDAWLAPLGLQTMRVPYPFFGAAQSPAAHLRVRAVGEGGWHEAELASHTGAIARATLHDKAEAARDRAVARALAAAVTSDALLVAGAVKGGKAGGMMQLVGLGVSVAHNVAAQADLRSWRTLFDRVELLALPARAMPPASPAQASPAASKVASTSSVATAPALTPPVLAADAYAVELELEIEAPDGTRLQRVQRVVLDPQRTNFLVLRSL